MLIRPLGNAGSNPERDLPRLAAKNPLVLASIVRYLLDARGVDSPVGHYNYNRIDDAAHL